MPDPSEAWTVQSNLWSRADVVEEVEHGAAAVGIVAYPLRRLLWVRLRPRDRETTFVVSTVHLADAAGDELAHAVHELA